MRTNRTAIDQLTPQRADARIIRHTPPRMPAPPRRPTPSAARSSPSIRPTSSKSSNVPVGAAWPLDFCLLWLLADAEFRRIRGLLYNHNACIVLERRAAIDAEISEKHSTPAQRRFDAHQCVLGFWGRRGARGGFWPKHEHASRSRRQLHRAMGGAMQRHAPQPIKIPLATPVHRRLLLGSALARDPIAFAPGTSQAIALKKRDAHRKAGARP